MTVVDKYGTAVDKHGIVAEIAQRRRTCHACGDDIEKGEQCARIYIKDITVDHLRNVHYPWVTNLCRKCIKKISKEIK